MSINQKPALRKLASIPASDYNEDEKTMKENRMKNELRLPSDIPEGLEYTPLSGLSGEEARRRLEAEPGGGWKRGKGTRCPGMMENQHPESSSETCLLSSTC